MSSMTDDKALEELRSIHEELHRLREENEQAHQREQERQEREARYWAVQNSGGAGTDASRRAREATEGFYKRGS